MANRHSIVPFPVPTAPQVSSPPETVSPKLVSPGTFLSNSLPPSPPAEPIPPRLDPYPSLFQQRILPPPPPFPAESSNTQRLKQEHRLQVDRLTRQVHDLQVENNLLRSLVLGAKTSSSAG
ncbi:hypothetical protein [Absidia glauca]|uniref:Uncharacterized protein n=1 Tax=Absidia glauca TaxID=4829 RepID=A0A163JLN9_ABSGL|nr:hypothetical protein [Absidia glauca]